MSSAWTSWYDRHIDVVLAPDVYVNASVALGSAQEQARPLLRPVV